MNLNLLDKIEKTEEELIEFLKDKLPSGSGIDCDWNIKVEWKNGLIIASNSYHCMNEVGMYDDWADFTVYIDLPIPEENFRLKFNGKKAQYLNKKYMLREYLEDTIINSLTSED